MFWADKIANDIEEKLKGTIATGEPLIIRDEKTASGRIHVGSMRGIAIHGLISEILDKKGVANNFVYEINDFDPMDGLPAYLDKNEYEQHMGKPLYSIPSPDGEAENFAEYFAKEFISVIHETGYQPEFYRSSNLYKCGKMNDVIRLALEKADVIREIYKKVSGSEKPDDWLPLSVVCEKCGKIGTTKVTQFDGEKVTYSCKESMVEWAKGCGHNGDISPFDGNGKLPWKVEWAAKFKVMGVDIEGAGKDHSTKGGARDIANNIARKVFDYQPPYDIPYEFFLVGDKKMSSSKGAGSSAREIADLISPEIFRLALIGKNSKQAFNFEPDGDTIPILFDLYDRIAEKHFSGVEDDDTQLFSYIQVPENVRKGKGEVAGPDRMEKRFLPRFSLVAFLVQMPHMNVEEEVAKMKGEELTKGDLFELELRKKYAQNWLESYAPEQFKYELQLESAPEATKQFSDAQKQALSRVLEYVKSQKELDGQELHTTLHDIRKEIEIEPKDFFSALYVSTLGKESGPKAGWFLSVLDKDFLEKRLEEVSK